MVPTADATAVGDDSASGDDTIVIDGRIITDNTFPEDDPGAQPDLPPENSAVHFTLRSDAASIADDRRTSHPSARLDLHPLSKDNRSVDCCAGINAGTCARSDCRADRNT